MATETSFPIHMLRLSHRGADVTECLLERVFEEHECRHRFGSDVVVALDNETVERLEAACVALEGTAKIMLDSSTSTVLGRAAWVAAAGAGSEIRAAITRATLENWQAESALEARAKRQPATLA